MRHAAGWTIIGSSPLSEQTGVLSDSLRPKCPRSGYLVAGRNNAIGTEAERIMAKHIGAHTIEAKHASHAVLVSPPGTTTRLILDAAHATD
jgi:hypothetical protein